MKTRILLFYRAYVHLLTILVRIGQTIHTTELFEALTSLEYTPASFAWRFTLQTISLNDRNSHNIRSIA